MARSKEYNLLVNGNCIFTGSYRTVMVLYDSLLKLMNFELLDFSIVISFVP